MLKPLPAKRFGALVSTAIAVTVVFAFAAGCRSGSGSNAAPSKILLVSIDTTRADHLSAYGYARPTTPYLERIAARGVRAANAFAVMPTTDPSHASILTGQYPRTHGIMRNAARRTNPEAASLGTWLRDRGYRTAAITARIGLDPILRAIAGFDYSDSPRWPEKWRSADEIVDRATKWLSEQDDKWFLWVHLWEPHLPYEPPQPYGNRFLDRRVADLTRYAHPERFLDAGELLDERQIETAKRLYDGEIATSDSAVRKIVRAAYEGGPDASPPLIMLVSDHGESMAERQESRQIGFGHGVLLYNEVVWVPWITVWEGVLEPHVIETPLSLVDLAPTMMELIDPGRAFETEGRSIAGSLRGRRQPEPRAFYLERRLFSSNLGRGLSTPETAIIDYPWKLIENEGAGASELYHLGRDPLEKEDLFGIESVPAGLLSKQLAAWRDHHPLPEQSGPKSRSSEQQEQEHQALRALGYID
jgi:arylsulfatase A-like enzyme